MPNKEELAYLAGLFDGEGCISITQLWTKENYQLAQARIVIKMCDRQGIDLAHRLFGGTVRLQKRKNEKHRDQWAWVLTTRPKIIEFIDAIEPYCRIKTAQFEVFRQFNETFTGHNRKGRGSKVPPEVTEKRLHLVAKMQGLKRAEG
jgi:hypothetical protein